MMSVFLSIPFHMRKTFLANTHIDICLYESLLLITIKLYVFVGNWVSEGGLTKVVKI